MKKITVIGDGGWGTALALVLNANGHKVTVWGPFSDYLEAITLTRENSKFLPGIEMPEGIDFVSDNEESVKDADIVVAAMPTKYYRSTLASFSGLLKGHERLVSVAKGFDPETQKRMTQVAEEIFPGISVSVLSGPSHAEEVGKNIPTAVTLASSEAAVAAELQDVFSNQVFRVYSSDDVVGVELGGALKNVIAIAVGVSDGMGFGDNTRAALITRGLSEITRLGCALGASQETFAGLAGMGDLIVTCTSGLSRNRSVGERLGKGESIDSILGGMQQAAEGVWNCKTAYELACENNVDVPVTEEVNNIVHNGKNPHDAVKSLLSREVRAE